MANNWYMDDVEMLYYIIYTTLQMFGVDKIFLIFWENSLMFTKSAFI